MEAHTIQRIGAYLVDMILLSFFVTMLTFWIPTSEEYKEAVKESNELIDKLLDEDQDFDEYYDKSMRVRYTLDKETIIPTLIQSVLIVGYFATFAYYNNGQTLGKKLFKIKLAPTDDNELNHYRLIGRAIFIEGVLSSILSVIFLLFIKYKQYAITVGVISMLQLLFTIVCLIMVISRKDKKGLHDIIFRTKVIKE